MSRQLIPKSEIPEGVDICLENSKRFFEDANTLAKQQKYQSALLLITLSMEELGKANLLLQHFEQNEDVSKDQVEKYFRVHEMRLDEFHKMFENSTQMPSWAKGWKGYGDRNHDFKLKITYTDWFESKWHNPLYFHELALTDEKEIHERLKGYWIVFETSFVHAWNNLLKSKETILKQIETYPKTDSPTKLKIISMCKNYLDPQTINVSVKVTTSQILIHVNPNNYPDPKKIKEELKSILKKRFPKSRIIIKLTSEYVSN